MLLLLMRCSLQRYATQSYASRLTVPIITHGSCLRSNCSFAVAKTKPVPSYFFSFLFFFSLRNRLLGAECCVYYYRPGLEALLRNEFHTWHVKNKSGSLPKCLYQTLLRGGKWANNWSDALHYSCRLAVSRRRTQSDGANGGDVLKAHTPAGSCTCAAEHY